MRDRTLQYRSASNVRTIRLSLLTKLENLPRRLAGEIVGRNNTEMIVVV
jgi:hypothetical protein